MRRLGDDAESGVSASDAKDDSDSHERTDVRPTVGGDDLAWMFTDDPPVPVLVDPSDQEVARVFADLVGDWSRAGGQLTRGEVVLLAARRRLSAAQVGDLFDRLTEAGIEPTEPIKGIPAPRAARDDDQSRDVLGHYLRDIGRYKLIGAAREVELWALIRDGVEAQRELATATYLPRLAARRLRARAAAGREAHAELVCANLRLVVSIARSRQYESSGVELADRVQMGNLGLLRAADKFDGSLGYKFSTYATWWIRQAIERGLADTGYVIRIPVHMRERLNKIKKVSRKLTVVLGHEPTAAEIAEESGIETASVQAALELMRPVVSLDAMLGDEADVRLSDLVATDDERDGRTDPANIVIEVARRRDLARVVREALPARSALVVERRFGLNSGEDETLEAIASDLGVTRERVRQIEGKALSSLCASAWSMGLRSYVVDGPHAWGAPARGLA